MPRRVNLLAGLIVLASFFAMAMLILSGNATEEKPIATVEPSQVQFIEWSGEPSVGRDGVVTISINSLQSDPLKVVELDAYWEDRGEQVCSFPLSSQTITCEFDPENTIVLPGPEPGSKLSLGASVVSMGGVINQTLPEKTVTLAGRSWNTALLWIVGGTVIAFLVGIALRWLARPQPRARR